MSVPPASQPTAFSLLKVAGAWCLDDQGRRRLLRGINPPRQYPAGPEGAIGSGQVEYQPVAQCRLRHAAEPGHQVLTLRQP
jgi:hypothetical protein